MPKFNYYYLTDDDIAEIQDASKNITKIAANATELEFPITLGEDLRKYIEKLRKQKLTDEEQRLRDDVIEELEGML